MNVPKIAGLKSIFTASLALILAAFVCAVRADNSPPHHKPDVKAWKAAQASGKAALQNNDLPEAEKSFKAALAEAENFDAKDERLAESLRDLAEVYYGERKPAEAEALLRRAVEILRGSSNTQEELRCVLEYGSICFELRHYDEAIKSFQYVQTFTAQHLGRSHPLAVEASMRLAEIYVKKEDFASAEPLLKRSFDLFRNPTAQTIMTKPAGGAIFGRDVRQIRYHPNFAYALEAAGLLNYVYLKENKPEDAAAIFKQALVVIDDNAKSADPVFPESLYKLGLACIIYGNVDAARTVFDRMLVLVGKAKGPAKSAAFDYATRLQSSLSDALFQQKKTADAEVFFTSLANAADKNFGPESRESDVVSANLSKFYLDHGQFAKAQPLFERQLKHTEKFQPDSVALAPILTGLETVYAQLGNDAGLDEVYQKQIRVYEKVFGANSGGLIKPLTARAALLRKLKRDTEAEPLEARANAITAAQKK